MDGWMVGFLTTNDYECTADRRRVRDRRIDSGNSSSSKVGKGKLEREEICQPKRDEGRDSQAGDEAALQAAEWRKSGILSIN